MASSSPVDVSDALYGRRCGFYPIVHGGVLSRKPGIRSTPRKEVVKYIPVIQRMDVNAKVREHCTDVTVEQRYINDTANTWECEFVFDSADCKVTKLEVKIDNKVLRGKIEEKYAAQETYDDAIASGHQAVLGETKAIEECEVFSLNVGAIKPQQRVVVTLQFIMRTSVQRLGKDLLQVVLPITRANLNYSSTNAAEFISRRASTGADKTGLYITVETNLQQAIRAVTSPSHTTAIVHKLMAGKRSVLSEVVDPQKAAKLRKSLVLHFELDAPLKPAMLVATVPRDNIAGHSYQPDRVAAQHAITATFFPDLDDAADDPAATMRELIFVVDRSGSMKQHNRIERVKEAMHLFLRSLPEDSWFNIVGFGSTYASLFPRSVKYTNETLNKAITYVLHMKADMQGTAILEPLQHILPANTDASIPRQIFILTDGDVRNKGQVLHYIKTNVLPTDRVFTLGIGADASRRLVNGMATLGNGAAAFVEDNEPVNKKVLAQLEKALQPALTNIQVHWGSLAVSEPLPEIISAASGLPYRAPVFAGDALTVTSLLTKLPTEATTVVITAKKGDTTATFTLDVQPVPEGVPDVTVHMLAASQQLTSAEQLVGKLLTPQGEMQVSTAPVAVPQLKAFGTQLSLQWGIASNFTSFVAVHELSGANSTNMTKINTNTGLQLKAPPLPAGLGPVSSTSGGMRRMKCMSKSMSTVGAGAGGYAAMPNLGRGRARESVRREMQMHHMIDDTLGCDMDECMAPMSCAPAAAAAPMVRGATVARPASRLSSSSIPASQYVAETPLLQQLAAMQQSSGEFDLQPSVASLINVPAVEKFVGAVPTWSNPAASPLEAVLRTALILAILQVKLASAEAEWKLIAQKARRFIQKQLPLQAADDCAALQSAVDCIELMKPFVVA